MSCEFVLNKSVKTMKTKYQELMTNMNTLKDKMGTVLHCKEVTNEQNSIIWDTVCRSLEAILDRIRVNELKAQQLQETSPTTEKDLLNVLKMMTLMDAIFIDTSKVLDDSKSGDTNQNSPSFADQMVSIKHNIDLVSLELTKIKTVNETLANIVSNYNLELAVATSDHENDGDSPNIDQNNV
ncbi:uncharacterized protein LOC131294003 [Anopheles ziemanni]|uniref:uncharacterized protein LOC131294003 n=1 Tax=Anopheles ziemanni TaxID=345580 RepID=UPI00265E5E65|nr:uncharacterized protein LOC131294003 [Anopheles ziemanni]